MDNLTNATDLLNEIKENDPERYNQINEAVKIRAEKIKEYKKQHNIPEFNNPEEYAKWLETSEGKEYAKELERIRNEADHEVRGRGGKREGSGRKKLYKNRVKATFDLDESDIINLKEYAKENKISKNKAIHEAIENLIRKKA